MGTAITDTQVAALAIAIQAPMEPRPVSFALITRAARYQQNYWLLHSGRVKSISSSKCPLKHLFDHKQGQTIGLASDLDKGASESRWKFGSCNFITIPYSTGHECKLIKSYGQQTIEDIKVKVKTYTGQQARAVQNSTQICTFLLDSLTKNTWAEMQQIKDEWSIGEKVQGPMFFKILMNKTVVDNNHKKGTLRISSMSYLSSRPLLTPTFLAPTRSKGR